MNAPASRFVADPLSVLMPDCTDPAERDLRERLMMARDIASANLSSLSGHAQTLNLLIVEVAGAFVFAPANIETLDLAVRQCRALMRAAAGAELLGAA
jgi:hypothetical protein